MTKAISLPPPKRKGSGVGSAAKRWHQKHAEPEVGVLGGFRLHRNFARGPQRFRGGIYSRTAAGSTPAWISLPRHGPALYPTFPVPATLLSLACDTSRYILGIIPEVQQVACKALAC